MSSTGSSGITDCHGSLAVHTAPTHVEGSPGLSETSFNGLAVSIIATQDKLEWNHLNDAGACPCDLSQCDQGLTVAFWIKFPDTVLGLTHSKTFLSFGSFIAFQYFGDVGNFVLMWKMQDIKWWNMAYIVPGSGWHFVASVWRPYPAFSVSYLDGDVSMFRDSSPLNVGLECEPMLVNNNLEEGDFYIGEIMFYTEAKAPGFIAAMYKYYTNA